MEMGVNGDPTSQTSTQSLKEPPGICSYQEGQSPEVQVPGTTRGRPCKQCWRDDSGVKDLLYKHKDLSSELQHPCEGLAWWHVSAMPVLRWCGRER